MSKVTEVTVGMMQKINLGGYEVRDYSVTLKVEDIGDVDQAINEAREKVIEHTSSYYDEIKALMSGKVKETRQPLTPVDKSLVELEAKIKKAETEGQLRLLQDDVKGIKEEKFRKILLRQFNLKLITLKQADEND